MSKSKCIDQMSFFEIKLKKGDIIFKSDKIYAEIVDESETLYFLKKETSTQDIPTPCDKHRLIERIISGELKISEYRY